MRVGGPSSALPDWRCGILAGINPGQSVSEVDRPLPEIQLRLRAPLNWSLHRSVWRGCLCRFPTSIPPMYRQPAQCS